MKLIHYLSLVLLTLSLSLSSATSSTQEAVTVFIGIPTHKVSEGGIERTPEILPREKGVAARCVISKIGNDYYWASRDNVKLLRRESGSFVTFVGESKGGYVKIIYPKEKKAAALLSETEQTFDYVEHLTIGLRSVNYWGKLETSQLEPRE